LAGKAWKRAFFLEEQEMRIETDSDYYYDVLNVYDRLIAEIKQKYHSIEKASLSIGKSRGYLYQSDTIGSVQKLNELCEKFDIDFEFVLLGKNNSHHYTKRTINLKNLYNKYLEHKYKTFHSNTVKAIMCMVKKGKNNIKIATLLMFSDLFKTSPLKLI
jgi:hypothetical protein